MSHKLKISFLLSVMLLLFVSTAYAQRPTPTNVPTRSTSQADNEERGTIQGAVYQDVNGDGQCVNSGVEGEGPIEGVTIEFVSSDEETIIPLYSGPEGIYGLYAAGQSYWRVTAKPSADWVVTSENPLYAPVYPDSKVHTGLNFCVQKATNAKVILPQSGAPAATGLSWFALLGLTFLFVGLGMHLHTQKQTTI